MIRRAMLIAFAVVATAAQPRDRASSLVDEFRADFLRSESKFWAYVDVLVDMRPADDADDTRHVKLIKLFEQFGDRMQEQLNADISVAGLDDVWSWAVTYDELRAIHTLYDTFRRFQAQQTATGRVPSPKRAWLDLVETILHDARRSVPESMAKIDEMIAEKDLFGACLKEVNDMVCASAQSPQQMLLNLYNTIALTELKGYAMVQFSYMLLKLYDRGNFTKESTVMRRRFEQRTNRAMCAAGDALATASRDLWRCDPRKHVQGDTYEQITELLQGYVINEVDMNSDNTCRENCGEYQYAKKYGCFKNLFCRQQRPCNGKILNCKYVDSDMEICTAEPRSGRRYESIEYENGLVYGRRQSCPRGPTKVDSWWRWLFWHCSYCMCICDEQGPFSDRYFNMKPVISDLKNNKVVTGLRFVKKNRIIHLQIQEGTLLPFGNIHPNSTQWVEPADYRIHDRDIYSGQDYHVLTWEKRAIDLDDLEADKNHVLTGIRFKEIGSHLNFEIYTTPFNFTTGKLIEPFDKSFWKDNPNTDAASRHPRTKVNMFNPDIPTRTPVPSVPLSKSDQFIEFTHTDFERDAAQTTVPFLDAQPLAMLKPVALSGAGLMYKGRINYGGFITPKIITYDFSKHLQPVFDHDDDDYELSTKETAHDPDLTNEDNQKEIEIIN